MTNLRVLLCSTVSLFFVVCGAGTVGIAKDDSATTTAAPVLQGGVVKVGVALNDVRDARLSVSRVRKAAANLYDEVTRQQMTMSYNPNVVGTTVIMTPSPSFSGAYLPPRRQWVNASMAEISPIMKLFKEDVDIAIESDRRADVSANAKESLDALRTDAFATVKTASDTFSNLESLTAGSSYDSGAIANASRTLSEEMKSLDKLLKKGISILQKEAKASKKETAKS